MIASRATSARQRHAVTLLEVLLVLCLLVVLAALSWPALERPLAGQKLRKAADIVRIEWNRARIEAMSSGRTMLFRYATEGDEYSMEYHTEPEYDAGLDASQASEDSISQWSASIAARGHELALPEGVVFVEAETESNSRAETIVSEGVLLGDPQIAWSDPILFYPDGTTSTTRLVLRNEYDRCIALSLRGLTGIVMVGDTYLAQQ